MSIKKVEPSFSIVDDDDDFGIDDLNLENDENHPSKHNSDEENIFRATKKHLGISKDLEASSDESYNISPKKKVLHELNDDLIATFQMAGTSSGRQTVTKMRAPPQLIHISSESDSEDSETEQKLIKKAEEFDPSIYDNLNAAPDIKELFQFITKYTPQHLGQDYKFRPFIPDYIPGVGDIDAFIKVIPPDVNINGEVAALDQSDLGLTVLDEPAANQSDPAVLHLQLRATSINIGQTSDMVIKKVNNVEKNSKVVDKWIKDISDLHRSKSSPVFKYSNSMPDLDSLLEEWPENMENLLKIHGFPSYNLRISTSKYVDIICCLFNIPVYRNKIESLHLLFSLYAAVKSSHLYRANDGNKTRNSSSNANEIMHNTDQLLLD